MLSEQTEGEALLCAHPGPAAQGLFAANSKKASRGCHTCVCVCVCGETLWSRKTNEEALKSLMCQDITQSLGFLVNWFPWRTCRILLVLQLPAPANPAAPGSSSQAASAPWILSFSPVFQRINILIRFLGSDQIISIVHALNDNDTLPSRNCT